MKKVKHAYHKSKSHVKQHHTKYYFILILFLVCIPFFTSIELRSTPAELPISDQWAANSVQNSILSQIAASVNQQYPLMPQAEKQRIAQQQLQEFINENQEQYQNTVAEMSQNLKAQFQDENGQTYLVALDPWYYFRFVRNIVDHGYAGEYLNENGESTTNFIRAPEERLIEAKDFHTRFSVFWHKFANLFGDFPLETTFFFVPVVIMSLATIPAFFIGLRLSGPLGGFLSALFIAIHPNILSRTIGGFSDTDGYNILFPLLIVWLLIEAIESKNKIAKGVLAGATGLAIAVYSTAWVGWVIFVYLIIGTLIAALILTFVKQFFIKNKTTDMSNIIEAKETKSELTNAYLIGGILIVSAIVFLAILGTSPAQFFDLITGLSTKGTALESATSLTSTWPNVLTTVAELNNAPINQIITQAAGGTKYAQGIFFIALLGIALLIFRNHKKGETFKTMQFDYAILFALWVGGTIYMSLSGVRFILLVAPAVAVLFGISLALIARLSGKVLESLLEIPKQTAPIIIIILAFLILGPIMTNAERLAENTVPGMNDAFYNTLIKIKEESAPDAIISSWWDFGHQFITIAQRGATADGGSQGTGVFAGVALAEDDPEEFVAISTMLNCGSNQGVNALSRIFGDTTKAVHVLREIIREEKPIAEQTLLNEGLTDEEVTEVLGYTHCDKIVESYWIASEDMLGKAPVWAHFGLWNFTKASLWKLRSQPELFVNYAIANASLTEAEAQGLRFELSRMNQDQGAAWISPWPRYLSQQIQCNEQNNTNSYVCPTNIQLSQTTRIGAVAYIPGRSQAAFFVVQNGGQQTIIANTYSSVENGEFITVVNESATGIPNLGISFIPKENDGVTAVVMSKELVPSMFNRMFYYNGFGLEAYIEKFDDVVTATGDRIITYKRVQ